jgi:hypothetical protein
MNELCPEQANRNRKSTGTPSIIVFDVNETLIDIESIGPFFERKFGDRKVPREWRHLIAAMRRVHDSHSRRPLIMMSDSVFSSSDKKETSHGQVGR